MLQYDPGPVSAAVKVELQEAGPACGGTLAASTCRYTDPNLCLVLAGVVAAPAVFREREGKAFALECFFLKASEV